MNELPISNVSMGSAKVPKGGFRQTVSSVVTKCETVLERFLVHFEIREHEFEERFKETHKN